jgi:hypothetical protein
VMEEQRTCNGPAVISMKNYQICAKNFEPLSLCASVPF